MDRPDTDGNPPTTHGNQSEDDGRLAGNAMAACLPFFEAIALRQPATIRLGLAPGLLLEIEIDFPAERDA